MFAAGPYEALGRTEDAVAAAELAVALSGRRVTFPLFTLAGAYAAAGRDEDAAAVLEELEALKETIFVDPVFFAPAQHYLGDTDAMFATLQEGVETGSALMMHPNEVFYAKPELRSDPRYREIMEQVGLGHTVPAGGQ